MAAQPVSITIDSKNPTYHKRDATSEGLSVERSISEDHFARNPFADTEVAAHYTLLYEKSQYECRHVVDATLDWSQKEEKKLVRNLDWHVCTWACIMFFALQVDRGNLSQAVSANMLSQLHLTTNEFNFGNTIFLVSFLLAELPSQLISKKLGPDRWIPAQMTLWSIVAASQCALTSKSNFYATRSLLGLLEGGFIPDIVLWLSYFYTSRELPIRLSFFWTSLSITGIVTSLLAFGLLHLDGVHGLAGWRWLFLIEGLITLVVGLAAFFLMPASAVQTKTWFRPNGWFTDRETAIVVNRVLRDDPSKGDMHNRMAITPRRLWHALSDYDLWPVIILSQNKVTCPLDTNANLDIRTGADCIYPPKPAVDIPHTDPPKSWFQYFQYQSSNNTKHCHWNFHPPWYHLAQRICQRTYVHFHDSSSLDAPLHSCASLLAWRLERSMAYVCLDYSASQLSLLSCHHCRVGVQKFWLCPYSFCICGLLQHVRSTRQCHSRQYLLNR